MVRTIDDRGEIGRKLVFGNMTNLAEQISRLANPAPVFHDPEDLDDGISSIHNSYGYTTAWVKRACER